MNVSGLVEKTGSETGVPMEVRAGEMDALVGARDWAATPLGPREAWPDQLRAVVEIVLSSGFPMFLLWGEERVMIYNDGYAPILGPLHPDALGKRFFDVWPDVRSEVEPTIDAPLPVSPAISRIFR